MNRYEQEFGKRNYRFTAGKVEFIAIDAQTLDGKKEQATVFICHIIAIYLWNLDVMMIDAKWAQQLMLVCVEVRYHFATD